jgi:hypothetical protein
VSFDGDPLDLDEPARYEPGMFPSAYVYVTAKAVLPNQQVFDPQMGGFLMQDLISEVFVQIAGLSRVIVPEPSSITLMALALFGVAPLRRAASPQREKRSTISRCGRCSSGVFTRPSNPYEKSSSSRRLDFLGETSTKPTVFEVHPHECQLR